MSETLSTMLSLNTKAPDFNLKDVISGRIINLNFFKNKKALLVMFICVHCPYVQHVKYELTKIGKDYKDRDLGIVAINSNDVDNYPEDSPENMNKMAEELNFSFPFLFDENQIVAKNYTAACTPDFFLFNNKRKLIYRGQLDDSRPGNSNPVSGKDLRKAIDAVLSDQVVPETQKPSSGCNIKWKIENEPSHY